MQQGDNNYEHTWSARGTFLESLCLLTYLSNEMKTNMTFISFVTLAPVLNQKRMKEFGVPPKTQNKVRFHPLIYPFF